MNLRDILFGAPPPLLHHDSTVYLEPPGVIEDRKARDVALHYAIEACNHSLDPVEGVKIVSLASQFHAFLTGGR